MDGLVHMELVQLSAADSSLVMVPEWKTIQVCDGRVLSNLLG